jgi:hypothetical protein
MNARDADSRATKEAGPSQSEYSRSVRKKTEGYAIPGYGSKLLVSEFLGMEDRNAEVKPTPQPEEHPTSYCRLARRYCGTETLFIAGASCPLYILRGRASWRVNISPTVIVLRLDSRDIMLPPTVASLCGHLR